MHINQEKKTKKRRSLALFLSTAGILMSLTACSSDNDSSTSTNTNSSQSTGTTMTHLTLGCGNFSDSLDPSANANSAWGTARYGIGETLFQFDQNMNAVPNLATGYEVDDSHKIWTISLQEGIFFSNGTEFTAESVKSALNYLYDMEASGTVSNRPSQYLQVESVEVEGENVVITTAKPYVDISKILSHVNFIILDTDSDMGAMPVGTGPYALVENNVGVSLNLEKNSYYWKDEVPFEGLNVLFMEDSTTKSLALQSGDVDIVDSITTAHDLQTLKSSSDFVVTETESARTAFSYMNFEGVLSNDSLREAILLAIDDETICDITVGGVYSAGHTILPPSLDYGSSSLSDNTPYNLEKAKEILDSAGIIDTDGDGIRELDGENISLNYVAYILKSLDTVAQAVVMNLTDLGIGVDLNIVDSDTHWNLITNSAFDLGICSWITVPVGDPVGFLENWYSQGTMNYGNYQNEDFDRIYAELLEELDVSAQKDMIIQLQELLMEDFAVMIHGYYVSSLSSTAQITGVEMPMAETYWITTNIKPAN